MKTDARALEVVESKNDDSLYVPEIEIENFNSNCKHEEVKVDQLYKDKTTFVSIMAKYVIDHNFNFKEKRSNKERYVYLCIF